MPAEKTKRPGARDRKTALWVAPLEDLDPEDQVYVHSNGLALKAGAAKRASWREFNIPDDKVVVLRWADGESAEAQTVLDEDRVQSKVGA